MAAEAAHPDVFVLKILQPVWLNTAKAKRGDVVTVDAELADRLILNKQAEPYVAA
jgi:hypothetical protein